MCDKSVSIVLTGAHISLGTILECFTSHAAGFSSQRQCFPCFRHSFSTLRSQQFSAPSGHMVLSQYTHTSAKVITSVVVFFATGAGGGERLGRKCRIIRTSLVGAKDFTFENFDVANVRKRHHEHRTNAGAACQIPAGGAVLFVTCWISMTRCDKQCARRARGARRGFCVGAPDATKSTNDGCPPWSVHHSPLLGTPNPRVVP